MLKKHVKSLLIILLIPTLLWIVINTASLDSSQGQSNAFSVFNEANPELKSSDIWFPDDAVICNATYDQEYIQICSDGAGGLIIVWEDFRNGIDKNIYAQRINSTGDVQWTENGAEICTAAYIQYNPQICTDDAGGAIIIWTDGRSGTAYSDLYAQRINSDGMVLWGTDGVVICNATDDQMYPAISADGNGGAIFTWMDSRNSFYSDIYAQRVNSTGDVQWTENGILICDANEFQWTPQVISDGSGGAIIVWEDDRTGNLDLYGQRVDADGNIQWTPNGEPLCTQGHNQYNFNMCSDNQGGVFIAWHNWESPLGRYGIYAQWVNSSGDIQWTANGEEICNIPDFNGNRGLPEICLDSNGDPIITWEDTRDAYTSNIFIQKTNSTGDTQWTENGIPIIAEEGNQGSVQICSDNAGGVIITWEDYRESGDGDIYAQRINANGDGLWALNGTPVCMANESQFNPEMLEDGVGGAIIVWCDFRNEVDYDIYAQRINSTGDIVWLTKQVDEDNGKKPIIPFGNYYIIILIVSLLSLVYIKKKQISSKSEF